MGSLGAPLAFGLGGDDDRVGSPVDHVAAALGRLCQQFRDKPKIVALVTVLAQRAQYVEEALWDLLTLRSIAAGFGAQLDAIGEIVNQPRAGMFDDDYRRYLFARIAVDRSKGTTEELISISSLVLDNTAAVIAVTSEGPATCVVRIGGIAITAALATVLAGLLRDATTDGVRLLTEFSESTPPNTFRLDSGPGLDVGHLAGAID